MEKSVLQPAKHVALIMDGNGRWATGRGLPRSAGHLRGIRSVRRVVQQGCAIGVSYLTLFAFSTENWQRNQQEVSFIMKILERYLRRESRELARQGIRIRIIGDRLRLPLALQEAAHQAEAETAAGTGMNLTLAISYGGQDEIVSSARALAEACYIGELSHSLINREAVGRFLHFPEMPPVDLFIRTGGEQRLSNFLLWQLAYAELIFLPTLWPDFTGEHLSVCMDQFIRRQRRYGREE